MSATRPPDPGSITGSTTDHLCSEASAQELGAFLHKDVEPLFRELKGAAAVEGFDLRVYSGYRAFHHQLSIWNRKVRGELAVLDSQALPLDLATLSDRDLVFAILRWSALPGGSRHHWGTDLDVYDATAKPADYEIELIPEEVDSGGMFGPLHDWLDERMADATALGFFRPYDRDRGGVAPERWHWSCGPVARGFEGAMSQELLREVIASADMELKGVVLDELDEIYPRFVVNVAENPA